MAGHLSNMSNYCNVEFICTVKFHRIFLQRNLMYWKNKIFCQIGQILLPLGSSSRLEAISKNLNFHFSPLFQLKFVVPLTLPLKVALLLLDTDSENLAGTTEMKKINFSYFQ
jgi:hypothetical protein